MCIYQFQSDIVIVCKKLSVSFQNDHSENIFSSLPTDVIEERDFTDVVGVLGPSDLQRLYSALGVESNDVEKAEKRADTKDVDLIGREVLVFWRKTIGRDATRQAILDAMDACRDTQAKGKLIQRWQEKYSST